MIQTQPARGESAVRSLDHHVGAREDRGGTADERRQSDQEDVERVDKEQLSHDQHRTLPDDSHGERSGGKKGER